MKQSTRDYLAIAITVAVLLMATIAIRAIADDTLKGSDDTLNGVVDPLAILKETPPPAQFKWLYVAGDWYLCPIKDSAGGWCITVPEYVKKHYRLGPSY